MKMKCYEDDEYLAPLKFNMCTSIDLKISTCDWREEIRLELNNLFGFFVWKSRGKSEM